MLTSDVLTSDFGRQHAPLKWKQSLTVMWRNFCLAELLLVCSAAKIQAAFAVQGIALTWKSLTSLAMKIVACGLARPFDFLIGLIATLIAVTADFTL